MRLRQWDSFLCGGGGGGGGGAWAVRAIPLEMENALTGLRGPWSRFVVVLWVFLCSFWAMGSIFLEGRGRESNTVGNGKCSHGFAWALVPFCRGMVGIFEIVLSNGINFLG